jgi:hypothetical protein
MVIRKLKDENWGPAFLVDPRVNASIAQEKLGFSEQLWLEIDEHFNTVSPDAKQAFIFLAGLSVGWREARMFYDKTWVKK